MQSSFQGARKISWSNTFGKANNKGLTKVKFNGKTFPQLYNDMDLQMAPEAAFFISTLCVMLESLGFKQMKTPKG